MNKSTTATPRTDAWECFSDPSYYDMARLRRTDGPKDFNTGYHLNNLREAVEVRDILNELERRAEKAEAEVAELTSLILDLELLQTSQQLERELAASKAEVEFWKAKAYEAEFYEAKHKAEVERLNEQLESTKQLALKFWKVLEENGFKLELPK